MKRLKPWILTAVVAALTLSAISGASAQPPQVPAAFSGTVTASDGVVAAGLSVEAYVGGTLCNNSTATTYRQAGSAVTQYFVVVAHQSQIAGCGTDRADVTFRIGGRTAAQTGSWDSGQVPWQTLNLTLGAASTAPESVTINVTVWRSVRTDSTYISTQPPGESWTTHNTPIDLSTLSASGRFYQGSAIPVPVDVGGSTVIINVTVWRSVRTDNTYISTQPPGEGWTTHNTPIDLSNLSASGRFYQGSAIPVQVDLQ